MAYGLDQSFKVYEREDCNNFPFKLACNKSKVKKDFVDDEKSAIYARRKVEVERVSGHIKGNHSLRRFSLRELGKVHTKFGIVGLAHTLLEVAGSHLAA